MRYTKQMAVKELRSLGFKDAAKELRSLKLTWPMGRKFVPRTLAEFMTFAFWQSDTKYLTLSTFKQVEPLCKSN